MRTTCRTFPTSLPSPSRMVNGVCIDRIYGLCISTVLYSTRPRDLFTKSWKGAVGKERNVWYERRQEGRQATVRAWAVWIKTVSEGLRRILHKVCAEVQGSGVGGQKPQVKLLYRRQIKLALALNWGSRCVCTSCRPSLCFHLEAKARSCGLILTAVKCQCVQHQAVVHETVSAAFVFLPVLGIQSRSLHTD